MPKQIIEARDAIKTTFPMLNSCKWGMTQTLDGDTVLICHTEKFGNPNDSLWNVLLESELPIYSRTSQWDTYYRMNNIKDMHWGFSNTAEREFGLITFAVDDYELCKVHNICIPLISVERTKEISSEIHICSISDISVDTAVRWLIDKVYYNYSVMVPTSFARAVVDYYTSK